MMIFRIVVFSVLAALLLYIPFYHFAPIYRAIYVSVPSEELTWWSRWAFALEHGGIQIYIAYVLMFVAIGLTFLLEYIYSRFNSPKKNWTILGIGAIGGCCYLWLIGFFPPMASPGFDHQGILFIAIATTLAFIFSCLSHRKLIQGLLLLLLFGVCIPPLWSFLCVDYFYFFSPALRILNGCAMSQTYFQYDQILSFFAMIWMKLGLPLSKFHIIGDFSYFVFFAGVYVMARRIFFNKQLAVYFIFSLVLIKIYGNLGDVTMCPQVTPLRLDLWLILLALAYWKGASHWLLGITIGFFLVFHHAFGMIYSISYAALVAGILLFNISKDPSRTVVEIKAIVVEYFPNACMMIGGLLFNQIFISSSKTIPALNYLKYNIGFMPISPKSFFWYVPVVVSGIVLLLWKKRMQLPQRYFQTGIFLAFLAIGNLLYFFGRSHENNLINIAASLWMVLFMLIDLIVYQLPQQHADAAKRVFVPIIGVIIVGMAAYYYADRAVQRIKMQVANTANVADLFKPDNPFNLDLATVKAATRRNPNIVFLSRDHDLEFYYKGRYTPAAFSPVDGQVFVLNLIDGLNARLSEGADIIIPISEFDSFMEVSFFIKAKYTHRISDFVLMSNNQ